MAGPTAEEAAMFGLTLDEATESSSVTVWPDNLLAVNTFISMSTQWRVGMSGATGLDYNAIPAVLRMNCVHRSEWPDIFEAVRVLEEAALKTMRKNNG